MPFEDQFNDAEKVTQTIWLMKLADLPRATNRALIDRLFNGFAPYTDAEVQQNRIVTNVNDLTATRSAHAMRRQFNQAFLRPGNYFTVRLNSGPKIKRRDWSQIVTEEINRVMKRGKSAAKYTETLRNVFAQVTLHGSGPVMWPDKQSWCPAMHGMGDVMLPTMTYRDMSNLSYFGVYRRYTADQLYRKTHGPAVDKGWNIPVAEQCIQWAQKQYGQTISTSDAIYNPERWEEAIKANPGFWSTDVIPTVNAWDFYYTKLDDTSYGWHRKIVLDVPSSTDSKPSMGKDILDSNGTMLYDSGKRVYADKLGQAIHFQFADGNVVAPFVYQSIRSLGWMLYSVCHLTNRLYCKLHDATFESLLNYFRVANPNDGERLAKIDLINMGIIPEGWTFVPRADRWSIDHNLVNMAMLMDRGLVNDSAAAYNQNFGQDNQSPEKTATQINAEMSATSSMVSSMLGDAYDYQELQYAEIVRRFSIANSKDPDVREARRKCLERGVPPEVLDSLGHADVSAERVIGAGNKQLEGQMVQALMAQINRYDPDSQRDILRLYTFAATDDASLTDTLVPDQPNQVSDSVHDAQLSASSLLMGLPMGLRQGVNHGEYAASLLGMMKTQIDDLEQNGGTATAQEINGLQNIAGTSIDGQPIPGNGIANHIAILGQEPTNKADVKVLGDALGKLMNQVKAFAQRLQEAQGQGGQPTAQKIAESMSYKDVPESIKRQMEQAAGFQPAAGGEPTPQQQKAELGLHLNAAKTQQKLQQSQTAFEAEQQRKEIQNGQQLAHAEQRVRTEVAATDLRTAAEIARPKPEANTLDEKK